MCKVLHPAPTPQEIHSSPRLKRLPTKPTAWAKAHRRFLRACKDVAFERREDHKLTNAVLYLTEMADDFGVEARMATTSIVCRRLSRLLTRSYDDSDEGDWHEVVSDEAERDPLKRALQLGWATIAALAAESGGEASAAPAPDPEERALAFCRAIAKERGGWFRNAVKVAEGPSQQRLEDFTHLGGALFEVGAYAYGKRDDYEADPAAFLRRFAKAMRLVADAIEAAQSAARMVTP